MAMTTPALAQDADADRTNRIVFGGGAFNVIDGKYDPVDTIRLEARMSEIPVWKLHPWLGFELADGELSWFGMGLETDIEILDWLILTLQTGAGYYDDGPEDRPWNPESGVEFRHQVELAVRTENDWRVGLAFSHMSNTGMNNTFNPGIEAVTLNLHVPVGTLTGGF